MAGQNAFLARPALSPASVGASAAIVKRALNIQTRAVGPRTLRLGFVPLTDCAPLAVAYELGLFAQYGLRVSMSRELGWASIRDKIVHGELDAAHAVVGMPLAATLGIGSIPCECLTGLILNLHGNAITLSTELWRRGVRDAASLRDEIARCKGERTFTFGAVSLVSSHHFLLREWLAEGGVCLDRDVRIVIVPPPQMVPNLKAGHLDGFCVGEPWNSLAVQNRVGWCATTSAEFAPGHPEKVLLVRRTFAEEREQEHLALLAALIEACEWCDAPEHRSELIAILARPQYVNVPVAILRRGLSGHFDFGNGRVTEVPDFCVFHRHGANEPSADKAAWILQRLKTSGLCPDPSAVDSVLGRKVFRPDIYDAALRLRESHRPAIPAPVGFSPTPRVSAININPIPKLLWTT